MADLNRDANNAYSDYVNNVIQSNANIDIQRYQNLLEQYRIDQEKAGKEAKEVLEREIATIAQYDSDYTAEIQRREALNPNDPLIPYLKIARQEKLDRLETSMQERIKAEQETQKEMVKQAMDLWETLGYATQEIAEILNIPVGTKTSDYAYKQANLAKKSGTGTKGNQTYQNVLNEVQELNSSAGENYSENLASARYLLNSDLEPEDIISIMKQTNVRPEAFVREMVNEGYSDEDISGFVDSYTPNQEYRDKLIEYAYQ